MNQKGLAPLLIILVIAVALGVYLVYQQQAKNKICSDSNTNDKLDLSEAFNIAQESECATVGSLTQSSSCNNYNGTWWINIDAKEKKSGCNPACVVNPSTKTAEVNWRCTGALPSKP